MKLTPLVCRYVLDRYVACLTGVSHLDLPEEEKRRMKLEKGENIDPNKEFVNPGLSEEIPAAPQVRLGSFLGLMPDA